MRSAVVLGVRRRSGISSQRDAGVQVCSAVPGPDARSAHAYNLHFQQRRSGQKRRGFHGDARGRHHQHGHRVGKAVDYILHAPVPAFEPSPIPVPGIRSFALPVVGLYLFALHMAQVRGTMTKDEAAAVEQELQQLPDVIEDAFTRGDAVLREFADLCSKCERMEFFGAGPCRGAADFGVSKVLEAQGYSVLSQDIEEFAHQTFFSVDTHRLPSVLLVPSKGRCLSRAKEILFVLQKLERPVLVITDDEAVAADEPGVRSLCLKKSVSESLISLVFACIMTYLSSVMPLRASDIYMHGHAGVYQEDGLPTVRGSKVDVVL